jgi:hypothetical protein
MMLEFCETVDPTLQDYEADGVCVLSQDPTFSERRFSDACRRGPLCLMILSLGNQVVRGLQLTPWMFLKIEMGLSIFSSSALISCFAPFSIFIILPPVQYHSRHVHLHSSHPSLSCFCTNILSSSTPALVYILLVVSELEIYEDFFLTSTKNMFRTRADIQRNIVTYWKEVKNIALNNISLLAGSAH